MLELYIVQLRQRYTG